MKKLLFAVLIVAIVLYAAGTAFAPLVTTVDKSKCGSSSSSDTSTVDLSDKDTSKPVKLLR